VAGGGRQAGRRVAGAGRNGRQVQPCSNVVNLWQNRWQVMQGGRPNGSVAGPVTGWWWCRTGRSRQQQWQKRR